MQNMLEFITKVKCYLDLGNSLTSSNEGHHPQWVEIVEQTPCAGEDLTCSRSLSVCTSNKFLHQTRGALLYMFIITMFVSALSWTCAPAVVSLQLHC